MRTIIIVQALIIIAGAYYIYTLTHPSESAVPGNVPTTTIKSPRVPKPDLTPKVEVRPVATTSSSTTVETNIGGPHDAGMEWPTSDAPVLQL